MTHLPNFFEKRYTKYFPLLKAQFRDYYRYEMLKNEPLENGEKIKHQLAQGMKKLEEIYRFWQSAQDYTNGQETFFEELHQKCEQAEKHLLNYAGMAEKESRESRRLHVTKALMGAVEFYKNLPQNIELSQENISTEERQQFIGEKPELSIEEAERLGKYKMMQGGLERLETDDPEENFYTRIRNRMQESYDQVLWNSTEYTAMFTALKDLLNCKDAEQRPKKIQELNKAAEKYINLKKDIPLTENGKTRLSLARELLDDTQLLIDGLRAKGEEKNQLDAYESSITMLTGLLKAALPCQPEIFSALPKNENFINFTTNLLTCLILKKELTQNGRIISPKEKSLEKYGEPLRGKVSLYLQDKVTAAMANNNLKKGGEDFYDLLCDPEQLYQDFIKAQQKPVEKSHEENEIFRPPGGMETTFTRGGV